MFHHGKRCKMPSFIGLSALALGMVLWTGSPAPAQPFLIPPDQSFVAIAPPPPVPVNSTLNVGPVVVTPDNRFVKIGGNFSMSVTLPGGPGFASFMMPNTANDRIKGSFIYGGKNPPRTLIVG